ncbi:MAG: CPBP family intramembrane metalloprotease [Candidatus Heimdallarchaeota archaeon]|nr:CPBP family intramembrane metalloprotease [Candidatus Heimdallarchaeota archaeon]
MEEEKNNSLNEEKETDSETDNESIICTNCGEKNPQTNLFCNFCGHHFVDKVNCSRCGVEVPIYNSYCSYCGAPMKLTQQSTQSAQKSLPITIASDKQSVYTPFHQLPPDVQERLREQQRKQKLESRNTIATVFGIIFIVLGIGALVNLFVFIFISQSEIFAEIIGDVGTEITDAAYYGAIIGMMFPPCVILMTAGISLLAYKPDNDAWKGLYKVLRFLFLGFSSLVAIFVIISIFGWIFYNPNEIVSINEYFWLFYIFIIPINMTKFNLYILLFFIYFSCILLMTLPTFVKYLLKRNRSVHDVNSETEKKDDSIKLLDSDVEKSNSQQELHILKLSPLEEKKGIMPTAFYTIKNLSFIKSIELLGASMISSIIIILILGPFIPVPDTTPIAEDPFVSIIAVAWAGVFEELSFRLILIGAPMVFVILIRYIIQENTKTDSVSLEKKVEKKKLKIYDIFLAIRGKYKSIGYLEWSLIGASSLIFGFAHWEGWTGSWGAWKIVQAGLSGFFLSYAFVKYGIESAIFIHITNNVISALSVVSVEVGNSSWITAITNVLIWGLMFIGIMKGVSVIINFILNRNVKQRAQTSYL